MRLIEALTERVQFLRNPHFSVGTKLRRLRSHEGAFSKLVLRNGVRLETPSAQDRAAACFVFINLMYAALNCRDAVVIDIGGHRGYFALYALLHGAAKVIVLECEPDNIRAIQSLIRTNHLESRIVLIPKAAARGAGRVTFRVYGASWSHSLFERSDKGSVRELEVETISLEGILEEAHARNGHRIVVKSNCEGAEVDIFQDIPSDIQEIYVAHHSFAPMDVDSFRHLLENAGFRVVTLNESPDEAHTNLHCVRSRRM